MQYLNRIGSLGLLVAGRTLSVNLVSVELLVGGHVLVHRMHRVVIVLLHSFDRHVFAIL